MRVISSFTQLGWFCAQNSWNIRSLVTTHFPAYWFPEAFCKVVWNTCRLKICHKQNGVFLFQNNHSLWNCCLWGWKATALLLICSNFSILCEKSSDHAEEGYANVIKLCQSALTTSCQMFWNDKPNKKIYLSHTNRPHLFWAGSFGVRSTMPIVVC